MEGVELERQAEEVTDLRFRLAASWLDTDTAASRGDLHFAPGDDSDQSAVVPDRRPIGTEVAEAGGRELEVVRLGNTEEHGRMNASYCAGPESARADCGRVSRASVASSSWKSVNFSYAIPCSAR